MKVFRILASKRLHLSEQFEFLKTCEKGYRLTEVSCLNCDTSILQLHCGVLMTSTEGSDILKFLMWTTDKRNAILAIQHMQHWVGGVQGVRRDIYLIGKVENNKFVIDYDRANVISDYYIGDQEFNYTGQVNEDLMFHGHGVRKNQQRIWSLFQHETVVERFGEYNDEYSGDWIDGRREGHGTQHYLNGDVYTGQWVLDCRHGTGEMFHHDEKCVYSGEWNFDTKSGKGQMKFKSSVTLAGVWKSNNFPWQHSSLTTSNGDIYFGTFGWGFNMGGNCTVKYVNGDQFVGQFALSPASCNTKNNMIILDGDCFDHLQHRAGMLTLVNGDIFTGSWIKDSRTGDWTAQQVINTVSMIHVKTCVNTALKEEE